MWSKRNSLGSTSFLPLWLAKVNGDIPMLVPRYENLAVDECAASTNSILGHVDGVRDHLYETLAS